MKSEAKSDVALSRQVRWWVSFHVAENAQMPYDHEPTHFAGIDYDLGRGKGVTRQ